MLPLRRSKVDVLADLEEVSEGFSHVAAMRFAGADPAAVAQASGDLGERQGELLDELASLS
jgi:hypothetical protein